MIYVERVVWAILGHFDPLIFYTIQFILVLYSDVPQNLILIDISSDNPVDNWFNLSNSILVKISELSSLEWARKYLIYGRKSSEIILQQAYQINSVKKKGKKK